eukprot:SAG31_NODE_4117_length_3566_cov_5.807038_2_plen_112_part_00
MSVLCNFALDTGLREVIEQMRSTELRGVQVSLRSSQKQFDGTAAHIVYTFDVRLGNFLIHQLHHRYSQARSCYDQLSGSGVLMVLKPPLKFPPKNLLSDMVTDSANGTSNS